MDIIKDIINLKSELDKCDSDLSKAETNKRDAVTSLNSVYSSLIGGIKRDLNVSDNDLRRVLNIYDLNNISSCVSNEKFVALANASDRKKLFKSFEDDLNKKIEEKKRKEAEDHAKKLEMLNANDGVLKVFLCESSYLYVAPLHSGWDFECCNGGLARYIAAYTFNEAQKLFESRKYGFDSNIDANDWTLEEDILPISLPEPGVYDYRFNKIYGVD